MNDVIAMDSLDYYRKIIKTQPFLTAEEEYSLAVRFRDGDLDAARQLIVSHLRLVVGISNKFMGYGLPQSDLIQEGNIGLMKAVKRFDPTRGARLVSFAVHWIRAEIQEYIVKNWRLVKIASTKAQRKLFFNLRSMRKGLGTLQPTEIKQIAESLNVKHREVVEMEVRLGGHEISMDQTFDDDETKSPIVVLADDRLEPSMALEEKEINNREVGGLATALASLDERSQRVIKARWLEDNGRTLMDLAEEFNVSAERIRQIEQTAIGKIRALMVQND